VLVTGSRENYHEIKETKYEGNGNLHDFGQFRNSKPVCILTSYTNKI